MNETAHKKEEVDPEFNNLISFIRLQKGIDLSTYRQAFLQRRLRLRLSIMKANTYTEYMKVLRQDPEEFNRFLDTLGVNVTEFFRDPEMFTALRKTVIQELIQKKENSGSAMLRIWSAACATGEEPYSLAIILHEELAGRKTIGVKIWATDMDKEALRKAEAAEYNGNDFRKLDKKVLDKYFTPVYNNRYLLKDEIRQMVKFQQHNLITEPPLNFMDIVFCRNMMIYLNRAQQTILGEKFHSALNAKGYLVVGKIENIWNKELFEFVNTREKIYQKIG